jgi:hypothetical protein
VKSDLPACSRGVQPDHFEQPGDRRLPPGD